MLGVAVQDALAASLLAPSGRNLVLDNTVANCPDLPEVFDGQRWAQEAETDGPSWFL